MSLKDNIKRVKCILFVVNVNYLNLLFMQLLLFFGCIIIKRHEWGVLCIKFNQITEVSVSDGSVYVESR